MSRFFAFVAMALAGTVILLAQPPIPGPIKASGEQFTDRFWRKIGLTL